MVFSFRQLTASVLNPSGSLLFQLYNFFEETQYKTSRICVRLVSAFLPFQTGWGREMGSPPLPIKGEFAWREPEESQQLPL
jgi:hypothetical protein